MLLQTSLAHLQVPLGAVACVISLPQFCPFVTHHYRNPRLCDHGSFGPPCLIILVIMYSRGTFYAFSFLCAPPIWMIGLLFYPFSYGVALDMVPCAVSSYFYCTCGTCVFFFFLASVPILDFPPFLYCALSDLCLVSWALLSLITIYFLVLPHPPPIYMLVFLD
jgi:hypothetical protein